MSRTFSTIVSGFKPRPFLYRMDLNYGKSRAGSLGVHSLAMFVTDFLTTVSGFKPRPLLYRIDLINDKSWKGSLRVHSLAMFITDLSKIVSGVVAPRHHLMMDLKSAKTNKKVSRTLPQATTNCGLYTRCVGQQKYVAVMVRTNTNDSDWARSIDHNKSTQTNGVIKMIPLWWGNKFEYIYLSGLENCRDNDVGDDSIVDGLLAITKTMRIWACLIRWQVRILFDHGVPAMQEN